MHDDLDHSTSHITHDLATKTRIHITLCSRINEVLITGANKSQKTSLDTITHGS